MRSSGIEQSGSRIVQVALAQVADWSERDDADSQASPSRTGISDEGRSEVRAGLALRAANEFQIALI